MKELKCPNCKHVFQVDDDVFESLASQVRTTAYQEEVGRRIEEVRRQLKSDFELEKLREEQKFKEREIRMKQDIATKESEVTRLNSRLQDFEQGK